MFDLSLSLSLEVPSNLDIYINYVIGFIKTIKEAHSWCIDFLSKTLKHKASYSG